jgi:hypothetical protein
LAIFTTCFRPHWWHFVWTLRRAHSHTSFPANLTGTADASVFVDCICVLHSLDSRSWTACGSKYGGCMYHCCTARTARTHRNAASVRPWAGGRSRRARDGFGLLNGGALSLHPADWALDLCGRAAEPLRLPHDSALAQVASKPFERVGGGFCLKFRDFGTDRRKRSSQQQPAAKERGCALGKQREGRSSTLRPIACPTSLA